MADNSEEGIYKKILVKGSGNEPNCHLVIKRNSTVEALSPEIILCFIHWTSSKGTMNVNIPLVEEEAREIVEGLNLFIRESEERRKAFEKVLLPDWSDKDKSDFGESAEELVAKFELEQFSREG